MYVTAEEVKKQANVDFTADDEYISNLIEASEMAVENIINTKLSEYEAEGKLAAPLRQAILLFAANLYENREPVSYGKTTVVPFTLNYLIMPYIKLT